MKAETNTGEKLLQIQQKLCRPEKLNCWILPLPFYTILPHTICEHVQELLFHNSISTKIKLTLQLLMQTFLVVLFPVFCSSFYCSKSILSLIMKNLTSCSHTSLVQAASVQVNVFINKTFSSYCSVKMVSTPNPPLPTLNLLIT